MAEVLPENHRMIDVFRRSGFPLAIRARAGTIEVELATALTEETADRFDEREARGGRRPPSGPSSPLGLWR